MAPFTVAKIIGAKGPFSAMTSAATPRTLGSKMHSDERGRHLFAVARARMNRVAGGAVHIIGRQMLGVAKALAISGRPFRGPGEAARLMTSAARRHRTG